MRCCSGVFRVQDSVVYHTLHVNRVIERPSYGPLKSVHSAPDGTQSAEVLDTCATHRFIRPHRLKTVLGPLAYLGGRRKDSVRVCFP
jgi:hypothetical protein